MNCQKALDTIVLALYEEATPTDRNDLRAHLEDCPHCADEARSLSSTAATVARAEGRTPVARVEGRASGSFAEGTRPVGPAPTSAATLAPRWVTVHARRPLWLYAAAAAVLLFVAGLAVRTFVGRGVADRGVAGEGSERSASADRLAPTRDITGGSSSSRGEPDAALVANGSGATDSSDTNPGDRGVADHGASEQHGKAPDTAGRVRSSRVLADLGSAGRDSSSEALADLRPAGRGSHDGSHSEADGGGAKHTRSGGVATFRTTTLRGSVPAPDVGPQRVASATNAASRVSGSASYSNDALLEAEISSLSEAVSSLESKATEL